MTLNVTILTPATIYQSADFRLTDNGKLVTNRSAKSVVLTYSTWTGFVTYTGLGSWPNSGKALSDWVAGWLADGKQRSMAEVADHLADEGTKLLAIVQRQTRCQHKLTFTLAGFEAGLVHAFIISNFEDCFGKERQSPDRQLTVTTRKLHTGSKATVIITGYKPAVPTDDRRKLGVLAAKYPADGGRIRHRMEALNARAAVASKGLISQDCVVLSFRADGSGVLQLNNEAAEVPARFPSIIYGMNVAQSMNDALRSLGVDPTQIRLVQGGFASSHSSGPVLTSTVPCPFAVAVADSTSGYSIHEITSPDFDPMSPNGINDSGQVIGTGQQQLRTQPNIPWMMQDGRLTRLNYTGLALAVSKHGQVAGILQSEQGERATVYEGGRLTELPLYHGEPGVFAGTDSSASAISADGTVAGSVRSRTEERGRPNARAAVFQPGQPPTVLMELKAEFGSNAVDINERGQVLVVANPAMFDARSILWTPQDGSWCYVGNQTANVSPIALTDEGRVLGKARNNQAKPSVVICQPGGDWERLGIDDGWEAVDINNQGDVIGWAWVDRIQRPWLRLASGQIIWLPYVIEYHTTPKAINKYGQIIGSAVADHGQHAVIWQR